MIQDDWTIDYDLKTLTHTSGATIYTVRELYSWLMDEFDELGQLDDQVPMSAQTPTEFSLINGWEIPAGSYEYLKGGAVADTTNDDLWANIYTLGTIVAGTPIYVVQNGVKLTKYWADGHIDLLVRVKQGGVEIDGAEVTVFARALGNSYDHFGIDLTAGGRNAVPLATAVDLNNQTLEATIAGYNDITITFGAVSKDLNNGAGAKPYDVVIDCATRTLAQVYEYLKYVTRHTSVLVLDGVNGEQYISCDPAYSPVKTAPFGTFAGGKFFGARGVWLENYDAGDAKNFQLLDANGATQAPPNVVAVKVTNVVSGDRVAVFRLTAPAGEIAKSEYAAAAGNLLGNGTLVVKTAISSDTPAAGVVRIGDDRYPYASWSGSTFTLDAVTLAQNYAEDTQVYVPLIDAQATSSIAQTTLIYAADIPVLVRVRKKGILPFEVEGAVVSTGLTVAAIRTVDGIVQ
ncbi:MAG: hypothetical protein AB1578_07025 [Thermodesulfobacteriota bacterium]